VAGAVAAARRLRGTLLLDHHPDDDLIGELAGSASQCDGSPDDVRVTPVAPLDLVLARCNPRARQAPSPCKRPFLHQPSGRIRRLNAETQAAADVPLMLT
jgi:hypothetical protein